MPYTHVDPSDLAQWAEAPTTGHSVELYEDDAILIDRLTRFAGAALGAGDAVVIVATPEHRAKLAAQLAENDIDLVAAIAAGRYVALDAAQTLQQFMLFGHPARNYFMEVVGGAIANAAEAASRTGRHVAAYGEMVALLWAEGNQAAALELERLWNELAMSYAFYLHCAYPSTLFVGAGDAEPLAAMLDRHTHLVSEVTGDDDDAPSEFALLQQHARALQKHTERSA